MQCCATKDSNSKPYEAIWSVRLQDASQKVGASAAIDGKGVIVLNGRDDARDELEEKEEVLLWSAFAPTVAEF